MRAWLATIATVLLLPSVAAYTATWTGPGDPLVPELEDGLLAFTLDLSCQEVVDAGYDGLIQGSVPVSLTVRPPEGVTVAGSEDKQFSACPPQEWTSGSRSISFEFAVTVSRDVQGLVDQEIPVDWDLPAGEAPGASGYSGTETTTVQAAPYIFISATIADRTITPVAGDAMATFTVANLGNTDIVVDAVVGEGETADVVLPEQTPIARGASADMTVGFTPRAQQVAYRIEFVPTAPDSSEGVSVSSNVIVEGDAAQASPTPLLLVVAALALAARRP